MEEKSLTYKDIEEALYDIFYRKFDDPSIPSDIVIAQDAHTFLAIIKCNSSSGGRKGSMHTGFSGLCMFIGALKGAEYTLKITYNDVVLTREQTREFIDRIKDNF